MVTVGIFPFKENSHGRAGNRTRDLMISSQRLRPLDHEAGHIAGCNNIRNEYVYAWKHSNSFSISVQGKFIYERDELLVYP